MASKIECANCVRNRQIDGGASERFPCGHDFCGGYCRDERLGFGVWAGMEEYADQVRKERKNAIAQKVIQVLADEQLSYREISEVFGACNNVLDLQLKELYKEACDKKFKSSFD